MIVKPKTRGFICTTAHPEGCAKNVEAAVLAAKKVTGKGPAGVLVLGSSAGYGLACRVAAAFGYRAATIGVAYERPGSESRTGTAGWYNTLAFDSLARQEGLVSESINGDAFSDEMKERVIEAIKEKMPHGRVDMVVYSLAAPKRVDPRTGTTWSSVIKPIGVPFESKTVDFHTGVVSEVAIEPAAPHEIEATVKVMGGEDWLWWMQAMSEADVLAPGVITAAFSYIGPELTHPVYTDGTIGRAKLDLEEKARGISKLLERVGGKAFVSVNKALVTQASSAIPVVPLYISLLYRVMKDKGLHEDCAAQMIRMFSRIYGAESVLEIPLDEAGRIRMDDWEMRPDVQEEVMRRWEEVNTENIGALADMEGYRSDFFGLFGFGINSVDYEKDVEI